MHHFLFYLKERPRVHSASTPNPSLLQINLTQQASPSPTKCLPNPSFYPYGSPFPWQNCNNFLLVMSALCLKSMAFHLEYDKTQTKLTKPLRPRSLLEFQDLSPTNLSHILCSSHKNCFCSLWRCHAHPCCQSSTKSAASVFTFFLTHSHPPWIITFRCQLKSHFSSDFLNQFQTGLDATESFSISPWNSGFQKIHSTKAASISFLSILTLLMPCVEYRRCWINELGHSPSIPSWTSREVLIQLLEANYGSFSDYIRVKPSFRAENPNNKDLAEVLKSFIYLTKNEQAGFPQKG